jgi:hypothetical protein
VNGIGRKGKRKGVGKRRKEQRKRRGKKRWRRGEKIKAGGDGSRMQPAACIHPLCCCVASVWPLLL